MIKTTLEQEHNVSTIIESSTGFNSVGGSNGYWYVAVTPEAYDLSGNLAELGNYCVDQGDYLLFMNLLRISANDDLHIYMIRYTKENGYLDISYQMGYGYTTSVTSVKYNEGHIYITHLDDGSYYYDDITISTLGNVGNNGQYTGAGVDMGNTAIEYNGYKMNTKLNISTISSNKYAKNHIRMEKVI